jgi:tRNA isopentenyl-2-thiomethyl-A-37 hydroxylase MiaE
MEVQAGTAMSKRQHPFPPLTMAWISFAKATNQPVLALSDDMMSFMAGASKALHLLTDAAANTEGGDVSQLMATMLDEVHDFAEFMTIMKEKGDVESVGEC